MAKPPPAQPPPPWEDHVGTIFEGDTVPLLKSLPDGAVDCAFLDPPFNINYEYDQHDDDQDPETYLSWCRDWLAECARVLKPTGHLWLMISEEYVSELKVIAEGGGRGLMLGVSPHVRGICRLGPKLFPRHHVLWYFSFGVQTPKKLARSKTHILHFVRHPEKHTWNADAVRVPSARQTLYNDKRANPLGRLPDDTWILRPSELPGGACPEHDVWFANRICGTHRDKLQTPNQTPEQVVARALRLSTNPGDLVLDPFGGSFTTAAVAQKLGRRWISGDVSPTYCLQGRVRLSSVKEGDMLDRPDALDPKTRRRHPDPAR